MDEKVTLHTFPNNAAEALAILYLQQRGIAKMNPEQIVDEYERVLSAMKARHSALMQQNRNPK